MSKEHQAAGLPEYNWIPPVWGNPAEPPPVLADTDTVIPPTAKLPANPVRDAESRPDEEIPMAPAAGMEDTFKHGFEKWVHPNSDFSHTDPPLWNDEDMKLTRTVLGTAAPKQLDKLRKLLGRESLGMQRLAVVFEWILLRANEHLGKVNDGLGFGPHSTLANHKTYNDARDEYIAFLKDLDDHDPQEHGQPIVPGKTGQSGYGQAIKWAYIYPYIVGGRITAAKVSIQWNPHSSSNGVPVDHV